MATVEGIHRPSFHLLAMVLDAHWSAFAMVDLKDVAPLQFQFPPGFPITAKPSRLDGCRATFSTTTHGARLPL